MRTDFTLAQLARPNIAEANKILRSCVHCGFCNATCPTFLISGDELEGPRGRIYLMKNMWESNDAPLPEEVRHIDSCLSCLSCMTTCPSDVDYRRLVDQTRSLIEEKFDRPVIDRAQRRVLKWLLPYPFRFRFALRMGQIVRPVRGLLPTSLRLWLQDAPRNLPPKSKLERSQNHRALGTTNLRIALHTGCAQMVLHPSINEATIRLLTRHRCDVIIPENQACCGALSHHLGDEKTAVSLAKRNIRSLEKALREGLVDAILSTASGCSPTLKDYPHLLRKDNEWLKRAEKISALCIDLSEIYRRLDLKSEQGEQTMNVAYHAPCSLSHGQSLADLPLKALTGLGFAVEEIGESHICCGSAGTYSLLQSDKSETLLKRKIAEIEKLSPDVIVTSNIGCLSQITRGQEVPVVHVVELLDWATGGPSPLPTKL